MRTTIIKQKVQNQNDQSVMDRETVVTLTKGARGGLTQMKSPVNLTEACLRV